MFTESIENLLNRNLAASPAAQDLCAELRGQILTLHVELLGTSVAVESLGRSLKLQRPATGDAAATVQGTPLSLLALVGPDPQAAIQRGDVRITGDAEVAQRYQHLLKLLRPDLEEELSKLLGDLPAHRLSGFAQAALSFGSNVARTAVRNTSEYLAHETRDLVPRAEAEALFQDIAQLRDDAARLEARVSRLEIPA